MPRWNKRNIKYIHDRLREKGIVYEPLRDELTDHICQEVDEGMARGMEFKKACDQVMATIHDEDLAPIQDETFKADYFQKMMIIKNNFKVLLRNLAKYKSYAMLSIGGLALGLTCFVLIALYVKQELSYDQSFSNYESLYRITMSSTVGGKSNHIPTVMPTLGPLLKSNYPELQTYARIINYKYSRLTPTFRHEDKIFYESNVLFTDTTFFRLFDFPFLAGNPNNALSGPNSVVMTESMALKYFGHTDVLGKTINFNNRADLEITGVVKDIPANTHIRFDFLMPLAGMANGGLFGPQVLENWQTDWFWTYLLVPEQKSLALLEDGINKLAKGNVNEFKDARFYVQPIRDVHLRSSFDYGTDLSPNGDMNNLYIFISIGVLILLVSSINFINLNIAASTRRYKEIGVSKVLGAMKSQLRIQFVMESMITSQLAFLLAVGLIQLALPLFGEMVGTSLTSHWLANPIELAIAFGFTLLVGLFSGLYPAFFVSSFDPQRVLKGVWKPGKGGTQFRTVLVGMQVAISLFLVMGTFVVYQQLNFLKSKDLGFNKEQIIMLTVRATSIPKQYYPFKHKLESHSSIVKVSSVSEPVGREVQFMSFKVEGQTEDQMVKILNVGYDFVETMGLQLKEGRDFSRQVITDSTAGFIINEAAARQYGWTQPLGKGIRHALWQGAPEGTVIGVLKDFNFEPLHSKVDPLILFKGFPAWYLAVRLQPGQVKESLAFIEAAWKEFEPAKPFNFHFLDQSIQQVYEKEERIQRVFFLFAALSIATVALGLFGLVSFVAEQRLAEIGVRKILGASVANILTLFAKDYVRMMAVAFLLAVPVTYYVLTRWLENFAFHISLNASFFFTGGLIVLVVVMGTVFSRAWIASTTNPVDVLKSE